MYILFIIMILISIAYFTLYERKILGMSQNRISVNKVFMNGILQPLLDGLKLLLKEQLYTKKINFSLILFCMLMFFMMLLMNIMLIWNINLLSMKMYFMILLLLFGCSVYPIMLVSWGSYSKYSMISTMRCISQSVSYEIVLSFLLVMMFMYLSNMNLMNNYYMNMLMNIWLMLMQLVMLMIESSRTPFDFIESESELISGYNIELSSYSFVMVFLGEYGMIMFMCYSVVIWYNFSFILFFFLLYFINLLRSSIPRIRYDKMMSFLWIILLPSICILFILLYCQY